MSEQQHGGPAFVPPWILHDDDLSPRAKLLAGRVYCLTSREGYCWASNRYLADDLGANRRTLERWMAELLDSPHFQVEYERTKDGTTRRIYPANPSRKYAGWGVANLSPAPRKSADRSFRSSPGEEKGGRTPAGDSAGRPQPVPSCPACEVPLMRDGFCTECDAYPLRPAAGGGS